MAAKTSLAEHPIARSSPAVLTRAETIERLQAATDAIRAFKATGLYVFGSAARDDLGPDSDVDVFIDFDPDGSFTFVEWSMLEEFLEALLGRDVDVLTRGSLHPRLKKRIEQSSIQVY